MIATGQMTTNFNVNIHLKSDFNLKPKSNLILKMKFNSNFIIFNFGLKFDFHFKNNINLYEKLVKNYYFHFKTPFSFPY